MKFNSKRRIFPIYTRMKRFAQEYVIREEDAENIVHDIFTELWEKKLEFSSHINLNGYLFVILKNRCIDFLRRKTTEQHAINKIQEEYLQTLKLKFESLEALDSKLFAEPDIDTIIQNAVGSLPEKTMMDFAIFAFAFNVLKLHRNSERTGKSLSKSQETTLNLCFFVVFISSSIIVQKLKIRLEKTYLMLLDIKKEPSRFVARIMLQSSTR